MPNNCKQCSTPNRDSAKYCKRCGAPIVTETASILESLVGLESVKNEIQSLINITQAMKKRQGGSAFRINLHSIIVGNTGTGKSALGKILQDLYFQNGITTRPTAEIIDAVDFPAYSKNLAQNIPNLKGGILFIDNAQKLVPGGFSADINQLDKLFSEMDKFGFDPIIILAGLPGGFTDFLDKNPSIRNRFKYLFNLPDYNAADLFKITVRKLSGYNLSLKDASEKRLKSLFRHAVKTKDESFGNAHLAVNTAENIFKEYLNRIGAGGTDDNLVLEQDISGNVPVEKTLPEVMLEMDEYIGMDSVKTAVKEIAQQVQIQQERTARGFGEDEKFGLHIVLTGNPGTGKTTIARKLGEVLAAINYLDSGHVIEVDRSKLVGQFKGETPKLVEGYLDKAMGGILFVDEAYALAPQSSSGDKDQYGQEAIETLMKRMEDDRGKFVLIAAGYQTEMQNFLNANPGMKSRFNKYLNIEDYNVDELVLIFKQFIKKKKYRLSTEADDALKKTVKQIYDGRDKNFGNGREMRKLFEDTISRLAERVGRIDRDTIIDDSVYSTIQPEDLPYKQKQSLDINQIMESLNRLTGLKSIKQEINNLVNYLNVEKTRSESGGKETALNLHFVFNGNPGTGKTTVARLMGNIFSALGLLSRGHLIEADSSKLVAGYSGQTAIKTNQVIDSALGGVLFIDEAYTLSSGSDTSFGKQAIDTLLKRMEDDRGKFIVIVAGYTKPMKDFLETNPGLASRFTKTINFEDYTGKEMAEILMRMLAEKSMKLDGEAESAVTEYLEELYDKRDSNFGNAREVRNIFESALQRQGTRLALMPMDEMKKHIQIMTREDLNIVVKPKKTVSQILAELDEFIGMDKVKEAVREIARLMEFNLERKNRGFSDDRNPLSVHVVLTGNPGTGKTSVARKLGEIFKACDFLPKGHVVEADRGSLVGQYSGQTPLLVNSLIDKAIGGILFVDEAYTLAPSASTGTSDQYGQEAVDTLMMRMENDRGKFVLIAAGYQTEMERFLYANLGMKSRFTKFIHIDDYKPEELVLIYKAMVKKKGYELDAEAGVVLETAVKQIYNSRDKSFANAREMRKLFENTITRLSTRLMTLPQEQLNEPGIMNTITAADIPVEAKQDLRVDDIMAELDKLTGMQNIKNEIRGLVDYLNIERIRAQAGGIETKLNLHFIFTGNPGTGKTTVARLMGKIFKALDLLPRGHVVEADRSKLVGTHIGQTAPKTNDVIDQSLGGILFIDEAYTLSGGGPQDFGHESVDTLLKRLEDDRGKFVAVAAGYTEQMAEFIEMNPGLKSRFTRTIHFEDYDGDAMAEIFKNLVAAKRMVMTATTENWLTAFFADIYANRDSNFGNARTVRNMFESALQKQSSRVSRLAAAGTPLDPEVLRTLIQEDIQQ